MAPATPFDWTYLELCGALNDISYHVVYAVGDLPHNLWNILAASLGMRDRVLAPARGQPLRKRSFSCSQW